MKKPSLLSQICILRLEKRTIVLNLRNYYNKNQERNCSLNNLQNVKHKRKIKYKRDIASFF